MLATQVIAPPPPEERAFRNDCQRSCAGPNVPEQVCKMVLDWFVAHLAVKDKAVQDRLLFETLKPVVTG